jgi:hypothetical protein
VSYEQYPVKGPFKGYQDYLPNPHIPPEAWNDVVNFLCRRGRLHTRFGLVTYGTAPGPTPDGAVVRNFRTFTDAQNLLHTLVLTTQNGYMLTTGPTYNALSYPGGVSSLNGTGLPYGIYTTQRKVFFSNGSVKVLYSDGESSLKSANAPGACRFLTVNSSTLIGAYWTEPAPGSVGSTLLPQRIRWAVSGDPLTWTGFTSGFEDLLDVPDEITGLATVGTNTLIFRTNGFTIMSGTGNGAAPFSFDHLSTDDIQTGNVYPYSVARFGQIAAFVSSYDIHTINSGLQLTSIGGNAKGRIFAQLNNAVNDVVQGYAISQLAPGIPYLSYWLVIPGQSTWCYHFDENNWQEFSSLAGFPSFVGQVVIP